MLCISKYSKYRLVLRPGGHITYNAQGYPIHTTKNLEAEFRPGGGIPPWAQKQALEKLAPFRGLPMGLEPLETIGWFDSDLYASEQNLDADDKAVVEQRLRDLDGDGFFIAEKELAPLPGNLANYVKLTTVVGRRTQEHVTEKVREFVDDLGMSADEIVNYETDHPRPESEFIIAAVTMPPVEEPEPEPVISA